MFRKNLVVLGAVSLALSACQCGPVKSEEQARQAYLGLDKMVERGLTLGFQGYNAAISANISPQTAQGDASGTITVTGQVDKGSTTSGNKGMRLSVALAEYQDRLSEPDDKLTLTYDTDPAALPKLDLTLRNLPNGTMTGTLVGKFKMRGDLEGEVDLNLSFTANLEPVPEDASAIRRVAGSTHVTGTASSSAGVFNVDVTR